MGDTVTSRALDYFDGPTADETRFLSFGYSLIWDRRDLRIYPSDGHYAELRIDQLGLGVLGMSAPDITTASTIATNKPQFTNGI